VRKGLLKRIAPKIKKMITALPKGSIPAFIVLLLCLSLFLISVISASLHFKRLESALEDVAKTLEDVARESKDTKAACEELSRRMDENEAANQREFAAIREEINYLKSRIRGLSSIKPQPQPSAAPAPVGPRKVTDLETSSLPPAPVVGRDESRTARDTFINATFAKSGESFEKRKYREAAEGYHAILRADDQNAKAAVYAAISEYYMDPKQYGGNEGIREMMTEYLDKTGEDRIVLKTLAAMSSDEGDWGASARYLGRMVEAGFSDKEECVLAANAYLLAGDFESSRRYFDAAAASSPKDAKIPYNAGKAFERADRPEEAAEYYKKALAVDAGYVPAQEALESQINIGGKNESTE